MRTAFLQSTELRELRPARLVLMAAPLPCVLPPSIINLMPGRTQVLVRRSLRAHRLLSSHQKRATSLRTPLQVSRPCRLIYWLASMSTAQKWTPLAVRLLAALLTPPLTLAQNGCEISSPALWPLSVGEEKEPSSAGQSLAEHIRNLLVRRLDRPIDPKAKPLPGSRIVLAVRSANTLVGYLIFSYDALPPAVAEAPIRHAWNLVTQGQLPFPFSGRMLSELEWMDCTRCAVWNCLLLQRSSPIHPNTLKWCDPRYERQGQDGRVMAPAIWCWKLTSVDSTTAHHPPSICRPRQDSTRLWPSLPLPSRPYNV
jgi:hypothetical protein